MAGELPISARALARALRFSLEHEAWKVRAAFQHKPVDQQTANIAAKRRLKQFEVKGRVVGLGVRWDVFELRPGKLPKYVLGDFHWQAEAIAHARDLVTGKVSIGLGGARRAITYGMCVSGLVSPDRSIDLPGRSAVQVAPNGNNSFIVSSLGGRRPQPKPKPKPKLEIVSG